MVDNFSLSPVILHLSVTLNETSWYLLNLILAIGDNITNFDAREFPRVEIETIENALKEMRNSDSVLLIDCQAPKSNQKDEIIQGDPRKYKTFAQTHPESLEVEGIIPG